MKKHSLKFRRYTIVIAALCWFTVMLFCSCVSRAKTDMQPLQLFSLMPADTVLFVQLPVKTNALAVSSLIEIAVPGLSQADIKKIMKRLDSVYAGFGSSGGFSAAVTGSFPSFALGAVLSKKNGWNKISAKDTSGAGTYYTRSGMPIQLAFPSSSLAYVSADVVKMFEKASLSDEYVSDIYDSYGFTKGSADDIRFYMRDASSFMQNLEQKNFAFTFPVDSISGTLAFAGINPESGSPSYALNALVQLSDSRALRPALAMLKIAMRVSGNNFVLEPAGDNSIIVSGAIFDIEKIVSLFIS